MARKTILTVLKNNKTYQMYLRQLITLAENVFVFKNLPNCIDVSYINKTLLRKGAIAFYYDTDLEELIALPFNTIGKLDIYGRPNKIQCIASNGITSRVLHKGEYVIMYDNTSYMPIYCDLFQYAERLALCKRTADINIAQQKTARVIQCPQEKKLSVERLFNDVDNFETAIYGYDNLDVDSLSVLLQPAPYIADKLDVHFDKEWSEAMRLIGISHVSIEKRERLITDEVNMSQGGTVASRFSRFAPRARAIKEINEIFGSVLNEPIEVSYYDEHPSTEKGGFNNELSMEYADSRATNAI